MRSEWKRKRLDEIIDFAPKEILKRDTLAKKISMDKLPNFARKINGFEIEMFKSGTKFRNGDTLMARITPCLENGKTAIVDILDKDEVGYGSTEFFVLRAKEGISDPLFIYYLSISEEIRNIAIASMTGTSGRQRAQKEAILEYEMAIPTLTEQKIMSRILGNLDSKIELNNQIINTLEETATTLFNHWFIDFEFPNKNGNPYKLNGGKMIESELGEIPEGWEVSSLKNITEIIMGQSPKGTSYNNENIGLPLINGASDFKNGFVNPKKYTTEPKKVTKKADIIFGVRATIGNPTIVQQEYAIGRGAGIARVIDNHYQEFVFLLLEEMFKYFANTGSGSVYINISKNDFENYKFVSPSFEVILMFHESVMSIFELIANKRSEIESLKELRDTLLPKLLSGEIELE